MEGDETELEQEKDGKLKKVKGGKKWISKRWRGVEE